MLSSRQPRLITQLQRTVPAGVNGGVTSLGMAASAAGGLCMGLAVAVAGWLTGETQTVGLLVREALQQQTLVPAVLSAALPEGVQVGLCWLGLSLLCGLGGSVVDSVLGATVQFSGCDPSTGKVVAQPGQGVQHISGRPWLSNDAVNATSATLTSLAAAAIGAALAAGAQ